MNKKKSIKNVLFVLTILSSVLCFGNNYEKDKNDFLERLSQKDRQLPYSFDHNTKLADRIKIIPKYLLELWSDQDKYFDDIINYKEYKLSANEKKIVIENIDLLPAKTKAVLKEKLVGIYFIKNFIGGGLTEWVVDKNNELYCYIIINPDTLNHDISYWCSMKENASFEKNGKLNIDINVSNNYSAFLYILMHETTHVLDVVNNYTPYIDYYHEQYLKFIKSKDIDIHTKFSNNYWNEINNPLKKYDFKNRNKINFYGMDKKHKKLLKNSDILKTYKDFSKSPFISIYGAQSWAEEFAELNTFYYFVNNMKMNYVINIKKSGKIVFTYEPLKSDKVKKRLKLISY